MRRSPAYHEGELAFLNSIERSDNPYLNADKDLSTAWEKGWEEACKDRKTIEAKYGVQVKDRRPAIRFSEATTYVNYDAHVNRLLQIENSLSEIGTIFETVGISAIPEDTASMNRFIEESVNKLRIPGFFAYHLAQEGLSLLHLIAAACAIARQSGGRDVSERIDKIVVHIDEVEPMLRKTLYDMEPYKSMSANEAIEDIAKRLAHRNTRESS